MSPEVEALIARYSSDAPSEFEQRVWAAFRKLAEEKDLKIKSAGEGLIDIGEFVSLLLQARKEAERGPKP